MERLDQVVARVLAGLRVVTEEEEAGDREGPRQLAGDRGGGEAHRQAKNDRLSPRATVRRGSSRQVAAASGRLER
jgi:hypothetical protein